MLISMKRLELGTSTRPRWPVKPSDLDSNNSTVSVKLILIYTTRDSPAFKLRPRVRS